MKSNLTFVSRLGLDNDQDR